MQTNFDWVTAPRGICKLVNSVLTLVGLSLIVHYGVLVHYNVTTDRELRLKTYYCVSISAGYLFLSAAYMIGYTLNSTMGKQPQQEIATSVCGVVLLMAAAALVFYNYSKFSDYSENDIMKANLTYGIFMLFSAITHGVDAFYNHQHRS